MDNKISFIKRGYWFLPNSSQKVLGTLTFTNEEGCSLELIGSLNPIRFFDTQREYDIILGDSIEGELITLLHCFMLNRNSYSKTGDSYEKYYSNFIVQGKHYLILDDICFDNFYCKIPNLNNWINVSGFNDVQSHNYQNIQIEYKKPADLKIDIDNQTSLSFQFIHYYSWTTRFDRVLEQDTILVFNSSIKKHFDTWLKHVYSFCYFLCIGYYRFTQPTSFKVNLKDDDLNEPIELLIFLKHALNITELKEDNYRTLFNYNISSIISANTIIQNLFKFEDLLEPILFIIGNSFKKTPIVSEIYFLTIVQAIETFHRRFIGGETFTHTDWNNIKKEILEVIPEKHKKLIEEALMFKNEYTLRARLKYLISIVSNDVLKLFYLDEFEKQKSFVSFVINIRNYYTHYDSRNKPNIDNLQLITMAYKIRGLLIFVFLNKLGLSVEDVSSIFLNNQDKFYFTK